MDIDKNTASKRFGKYFCSEEHASQYAEMQAAREADDDRRRYSGGGGGCC